MGFTGSRKSLPRLDMRYQLQCPAQRRLIMKMTHETDVLKGENAGLIAILQEMVGAVHDAAHHGTPVHEVERTVWRQVLKLGHAMLKQFFASLGTGDMG